MYNTFSYSISPEQKNIYLFLSGNECDMYNENALSNKLELFITNKEIKKISKGNDFFKDMEKQIDKAYYSPFAYEENDFNMEESSKIYGNALKVISYIKVLNLIYDITFPKPEIKNTLNGCIGFDMIDSKKMFTVIVYNDKFIVYYKKNEERKSTKSILYYDADLFNEIKSFYLIHGKRNF